MDLQEFILALSRRLHSVKGAGKNVIRKNYTYIRLRGKANLLDFIQETNFSPSNLVAALSAMISYFCFLNVTMLKIAVVATTFLLSFSACNSNDSSDPVDDTLQSEYSSIPPPVNLTYTITAQYSKDTGAFTQGIEVNNGKLYESTGDYENSSLRITDWKTGKIEKLIRMGTDKIFGEGITILNNKIYQLTWLSNIVYVYDLSNVDKPAQTLKWTREGWGLTNNGKELIISDGTNTVYFADPSSLNVIRSIKVASYKGPITAINELEYINGFIYANVYLQNYVIKIDPATGHVVGVIVLENLLQQSEKIPGRTDVLNGIAYDSTSGSILITGKRWPKIFELKLN
jgi:glutamine cyclotransferase